MSKVVLSTSAYKVVRSRQLDNSCPTGFDRCHCVSLENIKNPAVPLCAWCSPCGHLTADRSGNHKNTYIVYIALSLALWTQVIKISYRHLTEDMQNTSCERPGWMKHNLESRLRGKISITSDMQMIPHLWQEVKKNKGPHEESERGEWKSWLKTQHSEN